MSKANEILKKKKLISYYICKYLFCFCRRLTSDQKAVLLAYAETEDNMNGTINGITQTKKGTQILISLGSVLKNDQFNQQDNLIAA